MLSGLNEVYIGSRVTAIPSLLTQISHRRSIRPSRTGVLGQGESARMASILVVGGGGFVGLHTVRRLAAEGHSVWATHTPKRQVPAIAGVHWIAGDLTSSQFTDEWPQPCENILFLAQSRLWRQFPDNAADVFAVNLRALHQTVVFALETKAQRCIVTTTGSVYTTLQQAARENDPIDLQAGRSFYVASRLAGEILLGPYASLMPIIVLRLFMPYGQGMHRDLLLPQLVKRIQEGQPISLHGQEGLRANPVEASEVAEVLSRCLSLRRSTTLNVAGPEELTLREISIQLGKALGREARFEIRPEERPPVIVGDTTFLRTTLGWAPEICFAAGVERWLGRSAAIQGASCKSPQAA